ncbi:MAG: GNAT family N-acetyltransferase [Psychromonas sp.]
MNLCVENEVLEIREFIESDLDDFSSIVGDPLSMKYCPNGKLDKQQAEKLFVTLLHYGKGNVGGLWAIEDKVINKVIGLVGLQECAVEDQLGASFVYRTLPEYFEYVQLKFIFIQFIEQLIVNYDLPEITAVIAKNNTSVIQLMESLNFEYSSLTVCNGIESLLYLYLPPKINPQ